MPQANKILFTECLLHNPPSGVGHTLDPYLISSVKLGAHFAPLEPCFHICRRPVRFLIAPQFRIVPQPPGQRCGSCSRQENPKAIFPQVASVL